MSSIVNTGFQPFQMLADCNVPLNSNFFVLVGGVSAVSRYDTVRKANAQYVVPVGYKLVVHAFRCYATSAVASAASLGYGTSAVANSVSGPVGDSTLLVSGGNQEGPYTAATKGAFVDMRINVELAAGQYPYVFAFGGPITAYLLCQLVKL